MAQKYIKQVSGVLTEQEALVSSAGVGDAGKIVALDGTGRLDNSIMPTGIGADTASVASSENLAAGDFVNIYNDTGTAKCRKADAATNKEAHGFVLASVTSPDAATIYFEGANTQVSGQTPGTVFLSGSTPGAATVTPPSTATHIIQSLGIATSATSINFEAGTKVVLA